MLDEITRGEDMEDTTTVGARRISIQQKARDALSRLHRVQDLSRTFSSGCMTAGHIVPSFGCESNRSVDIRFYPVGSHTRVLPRRKGMVSSICRDGHMFTYHW